MMYGQVQCAIASEHGKLHLTVNGHTATLKQGNDLIRLTFDEARELAEDLIACFDELNPSNKPANFE